jgi:hypothetical protein
MAKVTNAFDTYSATSDREQLSDVIYNISPQATPFMSAIGKNSIKNVVFDWQTETLPTASGAGQLEGFELSRAAATGTTRVSNVAQISSRDATVTGSQQASDPAGKKSEMAHQLAIMAKALKRDLTHYFLREHDQLPASYLKSCQKFFDGLKHSSAKVDKQPEPGYKKIRKDNL